MTNHQSKMRELITQLNAASRAYYQEDREILSDKEYDALYDELTRLEAETGIQLATSPTSKVGYEIVSALTKAPHDIPMLSLDKTKDIQALADFLGEHEGLLSWKLDGLALVLRYENGRLSQALTRGNGQVGEDVTHTAKVFANIPMIVPFNGKFSVRGEAVITFRDFEAINASISALGEQEYKNPRNLCSGTVRQLNSEVAAERRVFFYALSVVVDSTIGHTSKSEQLEWLTAQGFDVSGYEHVTAQTAAQTVEWFKSQITSLPIATDGLVLTYNDIAYSESLGATSKFPKDSLAFKWADEISETTLLDIEWNPSRTGLINPVAIFEPVEIEGSVVSRASLHNVSILRGLELGIGDRITVYKANMIIPQVAENLTRSNTAKVPATCPICTGGTEITIQRAPSKTHKDTDAKEQAHEGTPADTAQSEGEVLICPNPTCSAKQMQSLVHFVGRNGLNIEGMSEQTLEKLLTHNLVSNHTDLFTLDRHEDAFLSIEGFGRRLYEKLLAAIEKAKDIALPNFIYALGIRHVGLANAKLLCAHYNHDFAQIAAACQSPGYQENLAEIKGFGEAIAHSLHAYFTHPHNTEITNATMSHLRLQAPPESTAASQPLTGLTFVITGDVQHFTNRKALQSHIESQGGRVTGSVTAKTSYLINNDAKSPSSKNKKAAQLGVPVITEDEFQNIIQSKQEA
ncbi:MAG: NAD-dependent DNA ligase LigA [Defluviitaleaceae bacterium]|nr:NAD-dependent DNA ligase LigA [Defluviitaleaceae bacterium]